MKSLTNFMKDLHLKKDIRFICITRDYDEALKKHGFIQIINPQREVNSMQLTLVKEEDTYDNCEIVMGIDRHGVVIAKVEDKHLVMQHPMFVDWEEITEDKDILDPYTVLDNIIYIAIETSPLSEREDKLEFSEHYLERSATENLCLKTGLLREQLLNGVSAYEYKPEFNRVTEESE